MPTSRLFALSLLAALPAGAQEEVAVTFPAGQFGTMIEGAVTGQEFVDYTLAAAEGQELFAEMTTDGSAFFNVMPPNATWEALYVGSSDVDRTARIELPEDGTYRIRVYLMGNDADTGQTVPFRIDLSIQ